jgi:hypothetical protein
MLLSDYLKENDKENFYDWKKINSYY